LKDKKGIENLKNFLQLFVPFSNIPCQFYIYIKLSSLYVSSYIRITRGSNNFLLPFVHFD